MRNFFYIFLILLLVQNLAFAHSKKSDYKKAIQRWTRSDELYQREDFYASVNWEATLLNQDFLEKLSHEVARLYDYTDDEEQNYFQKQWQHHEDFTSFFLSFYVYENGGGDFTHRQPLWKIRLTVDGQRYEMTKATKVGKPSILDQQLFKYIRPWAEHYYIYFPKVDMEKASDVRLTLHGPTAQGELIWKKGKN